MGCNQSRNDPPNPKTTGKTYQSELDTIKQIKTSNPDNIMAAVFDENYFESLDEEKKARLMKCLASGIENPDSSMGCYANSVDDYDTFRPFFVKALEKYHKVDLSPESGKRQENNWSLDNISGLPASGKLDVSEFGLSPLSMRVRVGRNLQKYPLPGSMSKDMRVQLEKDMGKVFDALIEMEEFGGRYVSITPGHEKFIKSTEYEDLVKAHVMFKDMWHDKYLNSAGISSDWPHGRGCYISQDEQFIIWVGEEDHLRIMCMQRALVLNDIFDRLKSALDKVEQMIDGRFAESDSFGVVTSCPTNIGTGMRASVHIQLPNLTRSSGVDGAKAVAKPLGLSVRGVGGEHTPIGTDGTVDISPSARFCISEAEIITALYKGIQELVKAETNAAPSIEDLIEKINKIKEENADNIMASCFDIDYFNSLGDKKDRFMKCLMSGIWNPDSSMGCYANSPRDYDTFSPFFREALQKYHKVDLKETSHSNNWNLKSTKGPSLNLGDLGLPELSMRVRVGRNLLSYPLPAAMSSEQRVDLEDHMYEKVFQPMVKHPDYGGNYYSLTPGHACEISTDEYKGLVDNHIMFKDMSADPYLVVAGIAMHWPFGRGCYVSEDKGIIVWVGEEDHLRIMCMKKGTILDDVFYRLKDAVDFVERRAKEGFFTRTFAFSKEFGVVTSCPTNIGTGMRASVHIQLPNLTRGGDEKKAKEICKPFGLSVRGLGGEHTPIGEDGTVDISPSARFCISEVEIITSLFNGIQKLKEAEDQAA